MVIGAGLAGAAVCAALARLGWTLTLIDRASGPAQGASALPVGMLSPHVTRAPTPLSRLSALGVASTRLELERLLPQGQGWQDCEVDNHGHQPGRWPAALVRPAALVHAWLDEARARTQLHTLWNTRVDHVMQTASGTGWLVLDAQQRSLAQAGVVVVANAFDALRLLQTTSPLLDANNLPLRPVKGQMSLAALDHAPMAPRPQRNQGVFVPAYEDAGLAPDWPQRLWSMGSTYRRGEDNTLVSEEDHAQNLKSLQTLCPSAAEQMAQALAAKTLMGWSQVRCASLDRLPLVGELPDVASLQDPRIRAGARSGRIPLSEAPRWPGLYILSALGSRGLTLAHWCASALASQIQGLEAQGLGPDPHTDFLQALDPARFAWKQARRQDN